MKNAFDLRGDVVAIFLNRRDGTVLEALINIQDFVTVKSLSGKWYSARKGNTYYVYINVEQDGIMTTVRLHRYLLGVADDMVVDHVNRSGLDNRRCNLRVVTLAQNAQNRRARKGSMSGVRGVSWHGKMGKWLGRVMLNGEQHRVGYFDSVEEAAVVVAAFRASIMPFSSDAALAIGSDGESS